MLTTCTERANGETLLSSMDGRHVVIISATYRSRLYVNCHLDEWTATLTTAKAKTYNGALNQAHKMLERLA